MVLVVVIIPNAHAVQKTSQRHSHNILRLMKMVIQYIGDSGVKLDNRSVVPYHKIFLKRYQAHINGPDRVVPRNNADDNDDAVDKIKNYYDCRYLSACEASWRIFKFDVHFRTPSIARLPFHLPRQ
uniref:Uncharacterized protein n=1 Tax=Lactuca sativa TaxID=4236 RepID=A0A9R1UTF0_LACSA|nr:hypothetical protein LSAT_V11C800443650 [Lactuca sativa]